jgi:preprotein translocase subunit SecY
MKIVTTVVDGMLLLISSFVAIMIIVIFIQAMSSDLPIIYWSTSEDKCVSIEDADHKYTCDNLPKKYDKIWVK